MYFVQSKYNKDIFYHNKTIYLLCTDNSILARSNKQEIGTIIEELQDNKLSINILDNIKDFLSTYISKEDNRCMHVSKPHLID